MIAQNMADAYKSGRVIMLNGQHFVCLKALLTDASRAAGITGQQNVDIKELLTHEPAIQGKCQQFLNMKAVLTGHEMIHVQ